LEKIIKVFEGEEIHLDPAMQAEISGSPIRQNPSLAKPSPQSSSLVKRGEGRFSDKKIPYTTFASSRTTEIYTHVSTRSLCRIISPLDNLDLKADEEM
jgi:hypothetical protein